MMGTSSCAIIFSYNSQMDVEFYVRNFDALQLDKMIICAEGDLDISKIRVMAEGKNIDLILCSERLGKTNAYNSALKHMDCDLAFLISGDVRFDPGIIKKIERKIAGNEIIIPRVLPVPSEKLASKIASVMWNVHDTYLTSSDDFYVKSGGEFQAIPAKFLINLPPVVNDDEFLCLSAKRDGAMVLYSDDFIVHNWVPETFHDLLIQRIRVNFGHMEMERHFGKSSSLILNFPRNIKKSVLLMKTHLKRYPSDIAFIFPAILIELISITYAFFDFKTYRGHMLWKVVKTSKDSGNGT
ncbi:MAG: glycosyltransferase family 2 protein [Candidatus Thermoplasmatota archaeon]|nr:glycosyltransferase family 2 protein [Candidatus Thermoplasmatota archaeon]